MADYVNVGKVSDFPDGELRPFTLNDEPVAVVNANGRFYAFSNECTHVGPALTGGGYVYETQVVCWLHGSVFDMVTGAKVSGPAFEGLTVYDVQVEGEDVLVGKP